MAKTLSQRYKDAKTVGYQSITNTASYVFLDPDIEDRIDGVVLIVCTSIVDVGRTHYRRLYVKHDCDDALLETHTKPRVIFDPLDIISFRA